MRGDAIPLRSGGEGPMFARAAVLALSLLGGSVLAGEPEALRPGLPWPAGPVRVGPTIAYLVHRPPGKPHAEVVKLALAAAQRRAPGLALVKDAEGLADAKGPAFLLDEGPGGPMDASWLDGFGRKVGASSRAWLTKRHPSTYVVVHAPAAGADAALLGAAGIAADLALALGGVVDDPEARLVFDAAAFEERALEEGFEGRRPVAYRHFAIHQYEVDGGLLRSISVGLSKLGLPDLVVNGHARSNARSLGNLLNVVAQALVEGQAVARSGWLEVDLAKLEAAGFREEMKAAIVGEGKGRATLSIAVGAREDGDADNALLELTFAGRSGSRPERQETLIGQFWGHGEDEVSRFKHDEELLAESARAKARLLALKPAWTKRRAPGDQLLVKGPFETSTGGNEWMWVEVTRWEGAVIEGLLANTPDDVPGLALGAKVRVMEADVFDYLLTRADGTEEGNTTGKLMERRQGREGQ